MMSSCVTIVIKIDRYWTNQNTTNPKPRAYLSTASYIAWKAGMYALVGIWLLSQYINHTMSRPCPLGIPVVVADGISASIHLTVKISKVRKIIVHFCNKTGAINNTAKTPANFQGIRVTLNPYLTGRRLRTIFNENENVKIKLPTSWIFWKKLCLKCLHNDMLCGVHFEYWRWNWPCYIETALYVAVSFLHLISDD